MFEDVKQRVTSAGVSLLVRSRTLSRGLPAQLQLGEEALHERAAVLLRCMVQSVGRGHRFGRLRRAEKDILRHCLAVHAERLLHDFFRFMRPIVGTQPRDGLRQDPVTRYNSSDSRQIL